MRPSLRPLALAAVVAATLAGAPLPPRPAFAVDGAVQWSVNGHWYKYFNSTTKLNWTACKANAESIGGYLVTMGSATENAWVYNSLVKSGLCWIGASDAASEGNWTWVNGEAFPYSSWDSGQPDNSFSSVYGYQNYALIGYGSGGLAWDDGADSGWGNSVFAYVVEWDADPTPPVPPGPPAAPSGLAAFVSNGNPISLLWRDNSSNEEAFEIERCTPATPYLRVAELGPNSAVYEDVATGPGTEYTYRVRAKNAGGVSDWSNEASVTASAIAPGPRAPSGLRVVRATTDSVELAWSDNSVDEIGFEVHRRRPGGDFALVGSPPPDSRTLTDTGLAPDTECEYGVRSLNVFHASGFCVVAAATDPTLSVTATRADLRDSPQFGRDSLKVQASFDFLPESPDGVLDVLAEGITLRVGPADRPVVMTLPKDLDTWKVKGTRISWKSAKGTTPKYSLQVDTGKRTVKATASCL